MTTKEPAIKARLSPTNEALFDSVEDFLLWTAQIAPFKEFQQYFRKVGGTGSSLETWREARASHQSGKVEAVLKKTLCTDGSTLFEAMKKQANKPR